MALDGAFLSLVKKELDFLAGSRVDKIYQPSREQIIIGLRYKGGSSRLLLSASADSARVHITAADMMRQKNASTKLWNSIKIIMMKYIFTEDCIISRARKKKHRSTIKKL